jgi:hypothetical protein
LNRSVAFAALLAAIAFAAGSMTLLARGEDRTEAGKDPGALWGADGRRKEDPPTPQVPPSAQEPSGAGDAVALENAAALGLSDDIGVETVRALSTSDSSAVVGLLGWVRAACNSASRGGTVPPCPDGVPEGSEINVISASEPMDVFNRTEADVRLGIEAVLERNTSSVALVGWRGERLVIALKLGELRTLPSSAHFSDRISFVILELSDTDPLRPIAAISMSEANPLSAYYRFYDPELAHLEFVDPQLIAGEREAQERGSLVPAGPVPTVSR